VRVYFLGYLTARRDDDAVFVSGLTVPRVLSAALGAPATNKLLRKLEEVRLALWLEEAMRQEYGTREQAKREIFARYASFIYLGSGRYGYGRPPSTTSASRWPATRSRTPDGRRSWPGSASRPSTMRPLRAARDRGSAATRSWP